MEKMDEDDVIIFSCATITLACALEIQKKPRKNRIRKTWMKDWFRKRDTKGAYVNNLQELRLNDHENFRKYLKVAAFVILPTSIMASFEIHRRFKGHVLNELRVSFNINRI